LIFAPCHHDCTIIAAINDYFSDTLGFQFSFVIQIARNLLSGSGRGEGAWETHHYHPLAFGALCKIDLLWREPTMKWN
jgi:hypothetical protein